MKLAACLLLTGCAFAADLGALQRDPGDLKGASATGHIAMGGAGPGKLLTLGVDTRVDLASGGSRWTAGGSLLGGIQLGSLPAYLDARAGIWRAIVSSTSEGSIAPSLELGAFIPLDSYSDPKYPEHGSGTSGVTFGVREDFDNVNYFTVFIGYALFIAPGY